MKDIAILIDSITTIDHKFIKENKIHIIHNSVNDLEGNVYIDDCTDEQKLKIGKLINENVVFKTSLINKEKIKETVLELLKTNKQVIFLCIGPGFSGQYNNALLAAEEIGKDKFVVVHSNSTACQSEMALNWVLKYIQEGNKLNEKLIQDELDKLSKKITTMFTTNNYKGFVNTGRVPSFLAKTLKLTRMFPIICAEETNTKHGLFRSWNNSIKQIMQAVDERFTKPPRGENEIEELYLCQSLCSKERIDEIIKEYANHFQYPVEKIKIRTTPLCVLMTTALDSFGIAIETKDILKKEKK